MLGIENLSVSYGRIAAVRNVSLEAREGEIVGLVGANGAGKSTIMKAALGVQRASAGRVRFLGQDVTNVSTEKIVASGLVYVPEGGGVLPWMTILENLQLGALHFKGDFAAQLRHVFDRFPILENRQRQLAGTLSGGERQMVAIGRALMSSPKLLMLDEPSLGLAPKIVAEVFNIIGDLKKSGYTILLSEQNAKKTLQSADRAYVLQTGSLILQGAGKELLDNEDVQRAYLS
ncbi:MAG: ABC transporter ATP-binding protein [Syntrophorhabdales bacterium]